VLSDPYVLFMLLSVLLLADPAPADPPVLETAVIRVTASRAAPARPSAGELNANALARSDAVTLGEAVRALPAVSVQVNSRGEQLAAIRGAGERQTAIVLDGAPLAQGWDERFDLALLPPGVLGGVRADPIRDSARFGPEAAGGALVLESREVETPGAAELAVERGASNSFRASGAARGAAGLWDGLLAAEHLSHAETPYPGGFDAPFRFRADGRRANSDLARSAVYARARRDGARADLAISVLHAALDRGVPPEIDRPPEAGARFWREPQTRLSQVSASVRTGPGIVRKEAVAWLQDQRRTIEAFDGPAFARVETTETGKTRSAGGRAAFTGVTDHGAWTASLLVSGARHDERVGGPAQAASSRDRFDRMIYAAAAGWRAELPAQTRLRVSLGHDWITYGRTGGRSGPKAYAAFTGLIEAEAPLTDQITLLASAGRSDRFPTLRELFGDALGRFQVNPALEPETITSLEAGARFASQAKAARVTVFSRRTHDVLEQETVLGETGRLRRRINAPHARVDGIETAFTAWLARDWRLDATLTLQDGRRRGADGKDRPLTERPNVIAGGVLERTPPAGWGVRIEAFATADAWSPDAAGALRRLPDAALVNLRKSYRWGDRLEAYARLDNAFDAGAASQAGLPAPGRWWRAGLRASF